MSSSDARVFVARSYAGARKDMLMENAPLGNYIRQRREELGLSQEGLAERVGGSYGQSEISRLECGHIELPRLGTLVSLAAALEVPVGNLLIASGWCDDGYFGTASGKAGKRGQDTLQMALSELESELNAIRDLERQIVHRTSRLRGRIRDLQARSSLSMTLMAAD
jgi:transcriptional regulator with XRE-family HTH domain